MSYDTNTFTLSIWNPTADSRGVFLASQMDSGRLCRHPQLLREYSFQGTLAPKSPPCDVTVSCLFLEKKSMRGPLAVFLLAVAGIASFECRRRGHAGYSGLLHRFRGSGSFREHVAGRRPGGFPSRHPQGVGSYYPECRQRRQFHRTRIRAGVGARQDFLRRHHFTGEIQENGIASRAFDIRRELVG